MDIADLLPGMHSNGRRRSAATAGRPNVRCGGRLRLSGARLSLLSSRAEATAAPTLACGLTTGEKRSGELPSQRRSLRFPRRSLRRSCSATPRSEASSDRAPTQCRRGPRPWRSSEGLEVLDVFVPKLRALTLVDKARSLGAMVLIEMTANATSHRRASWRSRRKLFSSTRRISRRRPTPRSLASSIRTERTAWSTLDADDPPRATPE